MKSFKIKFNTHEKMRNIDMLKKFAKAKERRKKHNCWKSFFFMLLKNNSMKKKCYLSLLYNCPKLPIQSIY